MDSIIITRPFTSSTKAVERWKKKINLKIDCWFSTKRKNAANFKNLLKAIQLTVWWVQQCLQKKQQQQLHHHHHQQQQQFESIGWLKNTKIKLFKMKMWIESNYLLPLKCKGIKCQLSGHICYCKSNLD